MYLVKSKTRETMSWLVIFMILIFSSCVSSKKVTYFKDIPDSVNGAAISQSQFSEPLIQADDILSISIQTIDPQSSYVVNQITPPLPSVGASSASPIGQQLISGFLIDKDGFVELPMIGKVKLGGLTTSQAREVIREKAEIYYKKPAVLVRFVNFKITVLGEVAKPATYTVPNEKVTLLDALGLAGDLTIFGKRNNVLLIRENGDKKEFVRFNLNSSDIFKSPYFYLKQNDVIYVEANKAKVAQTNSARTQTLTIVGSVISVLIILLTRI